ncbi:MAG TPA: CrcB family protein [Pontimonas sp.]|nr:CrcB family protein [Pontimonas sp.]
MTPLALLATVLLGSLGALLRWLVGKVVPQAPWWSLGIVNVAGSVIVGVLAALPETFWTYPLMVGVAGGLTTFSTLAALMVPRTTEKIARRALWPLSLHLSLGIAGCALGFVGTQAVL